MQSVLVLSAGRLSFSFEVARRVAAQLSLDRLVQCVLACLAWLSRLCCAARLVAWL